MFFCAMATARCAQSSAELQTASRHCPSSSQMQSVAPSPHVVQASSFSHRGAGCSSCRTQYPLSHASRVSAQFPCSQAAAHWYSTQLPPGFCELTPQSLLSTHSTGMQRPSEQK
jgi:hypothetical protein